MYCTLKKNCIFPKATNNVNVPFKMTSYSYTIIYSVPREITCIHLEIYGVLEVICSFTTL